MAHEDWIQARIDQVEELLDLGCELSQIVEVLNNDGFMRIYQGRNVTEDFVFDACLDILARRIGAKHEQEEQA
jgi:hypothetical protein